MKSQGLNKRSGDSGDANSEITIKYAELKQICLNL
jgi:hypothetical protein